jgi:osmoprotectant transport system permease protein
MTVAPMFNYFAYLFDGASWGWADGQSIPHLLLQHVGYTLVTVLISAAIALPIGLLIGHTNRFAFLAINIGNAGRSLPTFGLLSLMVTLVGIGTVPVLVALVVLAVPPILAATYAGIRSVDRSAVDAAVGMGMRPLQVLLRAEVPMALPLIVSGLRSALLQVCATATVAAYVGLGGLGRLLIDGLSFDEYDRVFAGALLVAVLAIVLDLTGAGIEHAVVSPGVRAGRGGAGRRRRQAASQSTPAEVDAAAAPPAPSDTPTAGTSR